jgi:predicted aspartyl protease
MPAYDADHFAPPAPVAQVTLRNPTTGAERADVPMLIDTGADVTLIPGDVATMIGLEAVEGAGYELVGFDGHAQIAPAVHAKMSFCGRVFSGRFLVTKETHGILGRNILNVVALVMDGPRLEWREAGAALGAR